MIAHPPLPPRHHTGPLTIPIPRANHSDEDGEPSALPGWVPAVLGVGFALALLALCLVLAPIAAVLT